MKVKKMEIAIHFYSKKKIGMLIWKQTFNKSYLNPQRN